MVGQEDRDTRARTRARFSIVHLTWRRHLQQGLLPHGVTLKQVYLLRQLARHEYLYPSQIADLLFCDRPTATVIIRNMEKQGWVSRTQSEPDRRQVRIVLTEAGRAKLAALEQSSWREVEATVDPLRSLGETELAELDRLLGKMNEHLNGIEL